MNGSGTNAAVIVAAGRGVRAGGDVPKQWQALRGRCVAAWTIDAFRQAPSVDIIVLVLHPDDMERSAEFPFAQAVQGGSTRAASVRAGLESLARQNVSKVLIHDAARPLVTQRIIGDIMTALDNSPGAAPALELTDAIWRGNDGIVSGTMERTGLYRAQTPQGFRFDGILAAHRSHAADAADDVEVARAAGIHVALLPGDERNLKITRAEDFARAELALGAGMDIRTGNGFDVHAFSEGDHMMLCGVEVPHDRGLSGHSDADVGLHAVTDAILGALAMGDIGQHFPPSETRWKDADSRIFLEHAVGIAVDRGYRIMNIDLTLICERPKIAPHVPAMAGRIARLAGVPPDRVSVKATTTERLGFTGRGEGIAAMATATLTSE